MTIDNIFDTVKNIYTETNIPPPPRRNRIWIDGST